nr:siphovirus ReqiPepy6 Gp37-like family protein [Sinosporangium album]
MRNAQYRPVGVLERYTSLEAIARFCGVGTWTISVDAGGSDPVLEPGYGVIIWAEGVPEPILSGPVKTINRTWNAESPSGVYTYTGVSDEQWLHERVIFPLPTSPIGDQTLDRESGSISAAGGLRYLANVNIGPGALVERRHPYLVIDDVSFGSTISLSARFDVLGEYMARIAELSGLGFRVVQSGEGIRLRIFQPVNRATTAILSPDMGNIASYEYSITAPEYTWAAVGCQGEGRQRYLKGFEDAPGALDWNSLRPERFIDRRDIPIKRGVTGNPIDPEDNSAVAPAVIAELNQAGAEALLEGAAKASLSVTPLDTDGLRFGRDYALGDIVTVKIGSESIANVLREVKLTDTVESGARIEPVVGTPASDSAPRLYRTMKQLQAALKKLESRR